MPLVNLRLSPEKKFSCKSWVNELNSPGVMGSPVLLLDRTEGGIAYADRLGNIGIKYLFNNDTCLKYRL